MDIHRTRADTTVFEALEKQLGLKLEKRKEPNPVIIIDKIGPILLKKSSVSGDRAGR